MVRKRAAAIAAFSPPSGDKGLDDWFTPHRTAAIARILSAVGKSVDDEDQLAYDIFDAYIATRLRLDLGEGAKAAERLQKVTGIRKAADKHASLISADPYFIKVNVKLSELRIELRSVETELSSLAEKWRIKADLTAEQKGRRPSEPEWLAGVVLPLVYERHFRSPAGRSRNMEGEPGGPTVRFIEATLIELTIPFKRESIVRAFSRLKRERDDERARKQVA